MSSASESYTNRLATASSPYLLQHAHQPVDWHIWGDEALTLAKQQDKPILLSIGYSACHWCHVMAHESFDDPETAEIMNRLFINIKVDREERPDLDKVYQTAHQILMQGGGGWPLTMFLSPDKQIPFFAGTYFPKQAHYQMPAFRDILQRVSDFYQQRRDDVNKQNQVLMQSIKRIYQSEQVDKKSLNSAPLEVAVQQLAQSFDANFGGFGSAPKFPYPGNIERLFHAWFSNPQQGGNALYMAMYSLEKMALGGLFDHIGGGFCRYSTDEQWMIPHFEKMLYDNGLLLSVYVDAYQIQAKPLFAETINLTAQWAINEMQAESGGYYSSIDADSEGEEGKFYLWQAEQVQALLPDEIAKTVLAGFGLDKTANFEGAWHLHRYLNSEQLAKRLNLDIASVEVHLNQARDILYSVRQQRIAPNKDSKILTAWNALMIKGMLKAGRVLNHQKYIDSAEQALKFIYQQFWQSPQLLATHHLQGYLYDYGFLLDALLESLQTQWNLQWLQWAIELAEQLLLAFEDKSQGGFYFTAHQHENLIYRPKTLSDEAIPAANGIAGLSLLRLGYLLAKPKYLHSVDAMLQFSWSLLNQYPSAYHAVLTVLEEYLQAPEVIILRGQGQQLTAWQQRCQQFYTPHRLVFAIDSKYQLDLPPALQKPSEHGQVIAYICQGQQCLAPIKTLESLEQFLFKTESH